ncbi:MAG: L-seryl-tRNA(Sec) selenium transferase [Proteobacteria bacterium]|nr:L-seryl-tRNA(Sec) selenium transferase [Pseudomonadota bacterium]
MNTLLRNIPKVDEILKHDSWKRLVKIYPESVAKDALRSCLDDLRVSIKEGKINEIPSTNEIIEVAEKHAKLSISPRLKRVINGTGVVIHTNLGRSLLPKSAIEAVINAASSFTNLEYDLQTGSRGDRYEHCTFILQKLTGAESALVVNNNAGAVFLILNTFAEGKDVVISRGELIEIGGSFRIPDVMKKSGALLREVGTTNRTFIEDYEFAISESSGLLMKAHTSNYRIRGFAHEATGEEILSLSEKYNLPAYYDAGSGLLFPIKKLGIHDEPCIMDELKKGWDIISFSGDKLLGAPQAGIILGEKAYIKALKKNPVTRMLRPDKLTLAALESTLLLYLDDSVAQREIPTLRMLNEEKDVLKIRALGLAKKIRKLSDKLTVAAMEMSSEVGGGSFPDVFIPSFGMAIKPFDISVDEFEERLRNLDVPIIGRIGKDMLLFDLRTILKEDEPLFIKGIDCALRN